MIKKISLVILLSVCTLMHCQNPKELMKNIVSEYTFPTNMIKMDSLELGFIEQGKGSTTLLFIHGLSSNADAWSKNIESLKEDFTCIAIDLPGYGKSSKLQVSYTPSYFAEVIHQFIQKRSLKNVVLIGHSMGGQAAIKLATSYPNDIRKLILVAPAGLETFSEANASFMKSAYTAALVKKTSDEQIEANYALNFYAVPEDAKRMIEDRKNITKAVDFDAHCEAIVKSIAGMLNEPVYNDLTNIIQQTLVIFGEQDGLIPNRYFNPKLTTKNVGNIALEQIQNVQLEFINQSGHFVQFEKPNEVNLLIAQFVE